MHSTTAIVVDFHCVDLWDQVLAPRLINLNASYDLLITISNEVSEKVKNCLKEQFPRAELHIFSHQTNDILSFVYLLPLLRLRGYQAVLKLHTKVCTSNQDLVLVQSIINALLPTNDSLQKVEKIFNKHPNLSLMGPAQFYLSRQSRTDSSNKYLEAICCNIKAYSIFQQDFGFFAGSMFWIRPCLWDDLSTWVSQNPPMLNKQTTDRDKLQASDVESVFELFAFLNEKQIMLSYPSENKYNTNICIVNKANEQKNSAEAMALAKQLKNLKENKKLFKTAGLLNTDAYSEYLEKLGWVTKNLDANDLIDHYLLIGQFSDNGEFSKAWTLHKENNKINWQAESKRQRKLGLVSIVMPVFNQVELTIQAVEAVIKNTLVDSYELLLVDNGSNEATQKELKRLAEQYKGVRLLRFNENKNFALGSNLGFIEGQGEYTVFLNNDTQVEPNWLEPLLYTLKNEKVYAAQPLLTYPDGSVQCMGVAFSEQSNLGYPIYRGLLPEKCNAYKFRMFQAITAACMIVKSKLFAELKGFDPIYVNGQEDIDLCLRLKGKTQQKAAYVSDSRVIHYESKTSGRGKYIDQNRLVFYVKWFDKLVFDDNEIYSSDGFAGTVVLEKKADKRIRAIKSNSISIGISALCDNCEMSNLQLANKFFREHEYEKAIDTYKECMLQNRGLRKTLDFNISLARRKLLLFDSSNLNELKRS